MWRRLINFFLVVLLLTSYPIAREVFLAAYREGMINGEYAFILFMRDAEEVASKQLHPFKWFISHYIHGLHSNWEVQKALKAVLILVPKQPTPSYSSFVKRLRKTISKPPFNSKAYIGKHKGNNMQKSQGQVG